MIYDCFTFYNELDLLEIRLNVLNNVVDKFVLVEMNKTFSGQDKPLWYQENKNRFSKFQDKIIHVVVSDCPEFDGDIKDTAFMREMWQRNCIARGLKNCKPDDVIIISDVDEIPKPEILRNIDCSGDIVWLLEMKRCYYFINYIDVFPEPVCAAKVLSYKNFQHVLDGVPVKFGRFLNEKLNPLDTTTAQKIRMWNGAKHIPDAGWHFSYLGGIDAIIKKIQSFSHQEFNTPEYTDKKLLSKRIFSGQDLFKRTNHFYKTVDLDESFPKYIRENKRKYRHLIFRIPFSYRAKQYLNKLFYVFSKK